jgi:hypothetical protein
MVILNSKLLVYQRVITIKVVVYYISSHIHSHYSWAQMAQIPPFLLVHHVYFPYKNKIGYDCT